jgi:hypothetical protein
VTLFTKEKLDNSRSVSNDESEGSKMIIWSHKSGSFPLADFDEYEEVAKLEKKDRELYIKLRQGGYDHQDAQIAVTDSTVEFV